MRLFPLPRPVLRCVEPELGLGGAARGCRVLLETSKLPSRHSSTARSTWS